MSTPSTASATAPETPPAATKPKGSRPSHRLSRVVEVNGAKDYQDVGALWPHKDGKGFSIKLKAALQPSDSLLIRANQGGN